MGDSVQAHRVLSRNEVERLIMTAKKLRVVNDRRETEWEIEYSSPEEFTRAVEEMTRKHNELHHRYCLVCHQRFDTRAKLERHLTRQPKILISDGAHNFAEANIKEYWTRYKDDRTEHIAHIHMAGDMHNNKMEAFNGELRDREKVMRSLKTDDSPILKGMQLYRNFVRPHMGLDGKTPADACGIQIGGENKWLTIIQNASYPTKGNGTTIPTEK